MLSGWRLKVVCQSIAYFSKQHRLGCVYIKTNPDLSPMKCIVMLRYQLCDLTTRLLFEEKWTAAHYMALLLASFCVVGMMLSEVFNEGWSLHFACRPSTCFPPNSRHRSSLGHKFFWGISGFSVLVPPSVFSLLTYWSDGAPPSCLQQAVALPG